MNTASKDYLQKVQKYVMQMRPVFQPNALFSDETRNYVEPMEPKPGETVTIRFRTGKNNVDEVYLINGEKRFPMTYEKTRGRFDFYTVQIVMDEEIFRYYFEVHYGWITCYYNEKGVTAEHQERDAFEIYPGYSTPDWAKGAVMYQIFVDRFYNGDTQNDVQTGEYTYIGEHTERILNWAKPPITQKTILTTSTSIP